MSHYETPLYLAEKYDWWTVPESFLSGVISTYKDVSTSWKKMERGNKWIDNIYKGVSKSELFSLWDTLFLY